MKTINRELIKQGLEISATTGLSVEGESVRHVWSEEKITGFFVLMLA